MSTPLDDLITWRSPMKPTMRAILRGLARDHPSCLGARALEDKSAGQSDFTRENPSGDRRGAGRRQSPKDKASEAQREAGVERVERQKTRIQACRERTAKPATDITLTQAHVAGPPARKADAHGNTLGEIDAYSWERRNDFNSWRDRD